MHSRRNRRPVGAACDTIERHLGATLTAIHLFGSALDGGLKPRSDVDLLVTVSTRPDESTRHALMLDLLAVSVPLVAPAACAHWK